MFELAAQGMSIIMVSPELAEVLVHRAKGGSEVLVASAPAGDGAVALELSQNGLKLRFDYTVEGRTSVLADEVDACFLSTRRAGGFTGTIVGLYAGK